MVVPRNSCGRPIWTNRTRIAHWCRRDWRFVVPGPFAVAAVVLLATAGFCTGVAASSSETVAIGATLVGAALALWAMPGNPLTLLGFLTYAVMLFGLTGSLFEYFFNFGDSALSSWAVLIAVGIFGVVILLRGFNARREYESLMKLNPQPNVPVLFETAQGPPYDWDKLLLAAGIRDYQDVKVTLREEPGPLRRIYLEIEK